MSRPNKGSRPSKPSKRGRKITSIGFVVAGGNRRAAAIAAHAAKWLRARGVEVRLPPASARAVSLLEREGAHAEEAFSTDMVVALGGDGTFLAAARRAAETGVPVLGVNVGGLGFLTNVRHSELRPVLEALLTGGFEVEHRDMLWVEVLRDRKCTWSASALNDVVISKGAMARLLHLDIDVGPAHVSTYAADGIIVATPTGSTAYSLSAGGPVVHPGVLALLITPICPHTLYTRPLVLPADASLVIRVRPRGEEREEMAVTADGQVSHPLTGRDLVKVGRCPQPVSMVKVPGADFYQKLKSKLHWGTSP